MNCKAFHVHLGDQSDPATLRKWIADSGGNFDVIIDDGGHTNAQIYTSLMILFTEDLKPGGRYFVEHAGESLYTLYYVQNETYVMRDVLADVAVGIVELGNPTNSRLGRIPKLHEKHFPQLKSMELFPESAVFTKCTGLERDVVFVDKGVYSTTSMARHFSEVDKV